MANILPSAINKGTIRSNGQRYSISSDTNGFLTVGKNDTFSNFNTADYANDSACIQAGLDMATTSGKNLLIQSGNYTITTSLLVLDKSDFTITGERGTKLSIRLTTIPAVLNPNVTSLGGYNSGIYLRRCTNFEINNLDIDTRDNVSVVPPSFGIRIDACKNGYVSKISGVFRHFGIFTDSNGPETADTIYIRDCILTGSGNADIIGGGPQNSSGTCNVRNIFIEYNTLKHDLTSPFNTSGYPICIDLVRVDEISMNNNHIYGLIAFGSEQFPNIYSTISNNIIKKAIGGNSSGILHITTAAATANNGGGYFIISDNVIFDGLIEVTGTSTANTEDVIVCNNICNQIIIDRVSRAIVSNNIIKRALSYTTGIIVASSSNSLFTGNLISNFTNGITNTGTGNSFFSNKYVSVLNNTL